MRGFLLSSETEHIAVIKLVEKELFYKNLITAIADHYLCEEKDVSFQLKTGEIYSQSLDITTIEEGEEYLRKCRLEEIAIY